MSLFISSLNSGSNGNCYYVGNSNEAVLIDVGISCRELDKRMERSGLSMEKVKAIFISHEHSDHIRGVRVVSKKYRLPVYITDATLKNSLLKLEQELVMPFQPYSSVQIGNLTVTPFPKMHDASDPYSFTISGNETKIAVITDIGVACEHVTENFKDCHAAFLEANYDEEMLEKGNYPFYLKKRISGGNGHLSNKQALELFLAHKPEFMSHLLLSHLSKNNNSVELVYELFRKHAGNTHIVVASRYEETAVYKINDPAAKNNINALEPAQMSLF